MLRYWGYEVSESVFSVSGQGIDGLQLDLRLQLDRARQLGIATPGVSAVLAGVD